MRTTAAGIAAAVVLFAACAARGADAFVLPATAGGLAAAARSAALRMVAAADPEQETVRVQTIKGFTEKV